MTCNRQQNDAVTEGEANEIGEDDIDAAVDETLEAIEAHIEGVCTDIPVGPDDPAELEAAVREDLAYVARNPGEYSDFEVAYECDEYRVVAADRDELGRLDARVSGYAFDTGTLARLVYGRACRSDWDWARDEDGGYARVVPRVGGDRR